MSREWAPGDVAAWQYISEVTGKPHDQEVALRVPACSVSHHVGGAHWHLGGGGWTQHDDHMRPLVVIDPEDREQVERLALSYMRTWATQDPIDPKSLSICADQMQAALREFADPKPPRPEEPTGLGAVVEDAEGFKWTRGRRTEYHWTREDGEMLGTGGPWFPYAEVNAVRVLNEGWSE